MDYEEMMLQISDVMRHANRLRPIMNHEEAVKAIRNIVTPKGKWEFVQYDANPKIGNWHCSNCNGIFDFGFKYCPHCGADMRGDV